MIVTAITAFLAVRVSGAIPDLTIDSFAYATPAGAQSNWVAAAAGKPVVPATVEQVTCLSLPNVFTTNTLRGYWDRTKNLDLSFYSGIALRLKSTRPSMYVTLYFQTGGGGWYLKYFYITDQWTTYVFPLDSFGTEGTVSGWGNVTKIRLSFWQETDTSPATAYVSNLRAVAGGNLLPNSGFEVTTAEAMPDYWGPAVAWGCSADQWVTNMDAWRARWGVDRTIRHSGTNSLRIVGTTTPPGTTDLQAVANWTQLGADDFTLSVWLRSDQPNLPVTLQVYDGVRSVFKSITTPATTNTWQRYSLNVTPTNHSDTVSCLLYPAGNGTLWVDDVQLETGTTATTWQPASTDAAMATQTVHKVVASIADRVVIPGGSNDTSSVDGSGRFLVNGQPFIPMAAGWSSSVGMGLPSPAILQNLAQAGFNTVLPMVGAGVPVSDLSTFLQSAKANGLKVILWMGADATTNTLRNWILGLKTNSPIIMWYVYDEPRNSAQWLDATNKYYLAKALDPSRAAMVNVTYLPEDISINYASDVLSMDYYPIGVGGNQSSSISSVGAKVETQHRVAVSVGKPSWYWPQSMGYAYFCSREPTGAEAEGMAYLALIHGARSLMYFHNKPRTLEQWNELRQLNSEVRILTPVLFSTNLPPVVTVTPATIHLAGKSYSNQTYLVAVNTLPGTTNATLTVSGTTSTRATVLFENRSVNVVGGQIMDNFAGYQRHVYCLMPTPVISPKASFLPGSSGSHLQLSLTWPAENLGWIAQVNEENVANPDTWFDIPWSQTAWSQTAKYLGVPINPTLTKAFFRLRLP